MRLRRIPAARTLVDNHPLVITERQALLLPGRWRQMFAAEQPLQVEIGVGQGRFLQAEAAARPKQNYVGVERRAEPLLWLIKQVQEPYPANLRLLHGEAARLTEIFAPGEVDVLYLFFSDPWPKSRHAKRRLTAPSFVQAYQRILRSAGRLIFKTDGAAFYHWSYANFQHAGWQTAENSEDWPLQAGEAISNYEQRFRDLGQPIYYAEFVAP